MRLVKLNQRTARMLRDNLTTNQEGYDHVDLLKLDKIARMLSELQGEYGEAMAAKAREERACRRILVRGEILVEVDAAQRQLQLIAYEVEDLHETAALVPVELRLTEGEWRLVSEKLSAVNRWLATDDLRQHIIDLVEAVTNAEEIGGEEGEQREPRTLRRR